MLKKKKAKDGHMQHGHTQWRVPTAPVAAKPAKKPKEEPKPAVGASSLCASHSPALSNPSVPAVQGAPLGKRPAARADSEPLKKQKKKVPKTNGAPAKSESSRPATGYTAAPIAPAAPAAQSPLAATAAATAAAHTATSVTSAAATVSASSSTKGPPVVGGSSAATGGMAPFSRTPIGQVAPAAEPSHLLLLLGLPPGADVDDLCQHFRSCAPLQVQRVGADSGL